MGNVRSTLTSVLWPRSPWQQVALLAALVFVVALAARIPLQADYFVNWDAVQFGLGTHDYNIEHHRPHPPGYIGYIAMGWLFNHLTGDANTSFVVMSLLAGALAPAMLLVLAADLLPRRRALFAVALFAASPLLWYYSGVALTYTAECALAVAFALFAWHGRKHGGGWLIAASITLALVGAVRQTGMVLLLPLWVWAVWPADWRDRIAATATLGFASLAWLVPLLWLAGGIGAYLTASAELAELSGSSTSIFSGNLPALGQNWGFVAISLVATLGAAAALIPGHLRSRFSAIPREQRTFLALWFMPATLVFLFVHMGQAGYVLLSAPPLFLAIGAMLPAGIHPVRRIAPATATAAIAINAALVVWLPGAVYDALPEDSDAAVHVRQYSTSDNDAHWSTLTSFVDGFDPETSVVLTAPGGPRSGGSFRHLSYYLPDFRVYAASRDHEERFGHLYAAQHREDDYDIGKLSNAADALPLPPGVYRAIVVDPEIAEHLDPQMELKEYDLGAGVQVWTTTFRQGTTLLYDNEEDGDDARIRAVPRHLASTAGFVAWRSYQESGGS